MEQTKFSEAVIKERLHERFDWDIIFGENSPAEKGVLNLMLSILSEYKAAVRNLIEEKQFTSDDLAGDKAVSVYDLLAHPLLK